MNFDNNLGARLREERDRLGFTQQEMTVHIGISQNMWSKYERGQAVPGGDVLAKLLAIGGDVLFILSGERSVTTLTADEKELLTGYRHLDIRGKTSMLGMLEVVGTPAKPASSVKYAGTVKQVIEGDQTIHGGLTIGSKKKKKTP